MDATTMTMTPPVASPSAGASCLIISPQRGWRLIDLRELFQYRDLFFFLVWRNVKVIYAQTVLGFAWAVIRPLFSMIIFTVVFGQLASIPTDGIPDPLFYYAALVPWTYFATSLTGSTTSLVNSANLITKVYFPRIVIPLTPVLSALVDFAIALGMLGLLMAAFRTAPTWNMVFLPLLVVLMVLTASGIGMWLSALAIQYRDVKYAVTFLSQFLMYAAPVVWPVSLIGERFPEGGGTIRLVYGLYPMAGVIEGFRAALFGTTAMPWDLIGMGSLAAVLLFASGALYFRRMERIFADVV